MPNFTATEFIPSTCEPTGRIETYTAPTKPAAVASVLYTKKLSDGRAHLGPTGLVVYANGKGYVITTEKVR